MKLWVDDLRPIPADFDHWAKTAAEAISYLGQTGVTFISLDHDLGLEEGNSGYDVARWLEEQAFLGQYPRMGWQVHSANPVGRRRMAQAMTQAESYWQQHEGEALAQWDLSSTALAAPRQPGETVQLDAQHLLHAGFVAALAHTCAKKLPEVDLLSLPGSEQALITAIGQRIGAALTSGTATDPSSPAPQLVRLQLVQVAAGSRFLLRPEARQHHGVTAIAALDADLQLTVDNHAPHTVPVGHVLLIDQKSSDDSRAGKSMALQSSMGLQCLVLIWQF